MGTIGLFPSVTCALTAFPRMILYIQLLFDDGILLIIPRFMPRWVRQHSIHGGQHHGNFVVHIFVLSFLLRSSSKPKAVSQKESSYPQRMVTFWSKILMVWTVIHLLSLPKLPNSICLPLTIQAPWELMDILAHVAQQAARTCCRTSSCSELHS